MQRIIQQLVPVHEFNRTSGIPRVLIFGIPHFACLCSLHKIGYYSREKNYIISTHCKRIFFRTVIYDLKYEITLDKDEKEDKKANFT